MTTIRTALDLSKRDVRSLVRHRYEILAIETRHGDDGDHSEIIWGRDDGPDGIRESEVPY
jgi:hypothetical protein